ncbi:hypothetical protein HGP17_25565 [Rhizobium sp. P38BS-XIX]|uniref:hypothetical protein n=1 Tax=Rhizobium sp. P38BS-XIX TaxID=2726740 RepID=UPI0014566B45|nr:hypothetical protein [Rhizobium sp. P38BS-XIX]NLS00208.1 hypothetical protein [Rhizobium sp. P38BS-XIX]
MSGNDIPLSSGLQALLDGFLAVEDAPGITIERDQLQMLIKMISLMQSMATNLEIEVRCLRDMEASRDGRTFLEEEATVHLADLLPAIDGNVVHLNFGRKK